MGAKLATGGFAPDLEATDCEGRAVKLSDYWKKYPVILALTRHSGCTFCRQQLAALRDRYESFREAGAEIVAVTMSGQEEALRLRDALRLPYPLLSDPGRKIYEAYGAERAGAWQLAGPQIWLSGFSSIFTNGMGWPTGDVRQLHAAFVISMDGLVVQAFYPSHAGDQSDPQRMLDACQIATPKPGSEAPV